MTVTGNPPTSDADFDARIAAIELAPDAPESWAATVERMARAIYEADRDPEEFWTVRWEHAYGLADHYRRLATAALLAEHGGAA